MRSKCIHRHFQNCLQIENWLKIGWDTVLQKITNVQEVSIQPVVSRGGIHFAWCRWGEVPACVRNHGRTSARTENFAGTPLRCCWIVAGVRVVTGVYFGSLFVSANWLPRVDNNDEILKSRLSRASQIQGWCFMKCVLHLIWLVRAALCNHLKKKLS